MSLTTRIGQRLTSELVQIATDALDAHLSSYEYSRGNHIVKIRSARDVVIIDGELVKKLKEHGVRGKLAADLRAIVEESATQLGYQRQPLVVTRDFPPIEGEIADGRNSMYWVKPAE